MRKRKPMFQIFVALCFVLFLMDIPVIISVDNGISRIKIELKNEGFFIEKNKTAKNLILWPPMI